MLEPVARCWFSPVWLLSFLQFFRVFQVQTGASSARDILDKDEREQRIEADDVPDISRCAEVGSLQPGAARVCSAAVQEHTASYCRIWQRLGWLRRSLWT